MVYGDMARAQEILTTMKALQDPEGFWINSYWMNGSGEEIRKHVGPVMWMAMAVMNYEKITGDTSTYHDMGVKAIDWCLNYLQPNGGIAGGETTWDVPGVWTEEVWISTEHNEDSYPTLLYFASTTPSRTNTYESAAAGVKNFLDNVVWDEANKRWHGGYKTNTGLIDPYVPLDVNPWGVMSLGASGVRDYAESLDYVENANGNPGTLGNPRYVHTLSYDSTSDTMTLYDFDWRSDGAAASDSNGGGVYGEDIWFEGSAFMSIAYRIAGDETKSNEIIAEIIKKQGAEGSMTGGIPYSLNGTNNGYWRMAQENCVSSTGWLMIALAHWNAFIGEEVGTNNKVATPTISPPSGNYTSAINVTTTSSTSGATIRYTTDGTTPTSSSPIFPTSLNISTNTTITARGFKPGMDDSDNLIASYTFSTMDQVVTPVIFPAGGSYSSTQNVTITCSTSGASIYYTTDGSTPSSSSTPYSGGISISSSTILKAIGTETGMIDSVVATEVYTIEVVGDYTWGVDEVDSDAIIWFKSNVNANWADVHYRKNGGPQMNHRMVYMSTTYRWEQTVSNMVNGDVLDFFFTYEKNNLAYDTEWFNYIFANLTSKVATPVFNPPGGVYTSSQSVTISTTTSGSTIHYTYDGSAPSTSSPVYTGAITVSDDTALKAIAVKSGMDESDVSAADYILSVSESLMIDDFSNTMQWNERINDLGQQIITQGGLYNLEGDSNLYFFYNGNTTPEYFDTYINRSISGYSVIALTIKGGYSGEESTVDIILNDGSNHSVDLNTYGSISTSYQDISIPLTAFGANLSDISFLRVEGTEIAKILRIEEIKLQ